MRKTARPGRARPVNAQSTKFVHVVTVRDATGRYVRHLDFDRRSSARRQMRTWQKSYGDAYTVDHASFPKHSQRGR